MMLGYSPEKAEADRKYAEAQKRLAAAEKAFASAQTELIMARREVETLSKDTSYQAALDQAWKTYI